ncbi:13392_t:CDS:2 [Dentiscutata heterogama]|uniref:13392_t:CDS:1 n=1 Tax=Dentiscutata heterogama TaxID=1316150 RepID=A0ACA9P402_9GLOM|nr:13392_t:CDS:2 [Dentiscutata heterogama]
MDDFDIEWNSPFCQICFLNRCDVIEYSKYEKYCKKCIHVEFIVGTEQKKISTTTDILLEKFPNSFFSHIIEDIFISGNKHIFEIPTNFIHIDEIERVLQGQELPENINMTLNNELWYFTEEEHITPFESEDFCNCGNLKQKKYHNCKTCQENLVKERAPWCFECNKNKVSWNWKTKKYFNNCQTCGNRKLYSLKIEDFDKKQEDKIRKLQTNIKRKKTRLMNDYKKNLAKLNNDEKKQTEIINKKYIQEKANINEKIKKREHELKSEDNFKDVIEEVITANKRQRRNTENIVILDEEIRNNVNTFLMISQERFEQIDRNRN